MNHVKYSVIVLLDCTVQITFSKFYILFETCVDPDHLASDETSCSGSPQFFIITRNPSGLTEIQTIHIEGTVHYKLEVLDLHF